MSSFFDRAKDAAEKVADVAADHTDQIDSGIDKAADLADKATGGKHASKLDAVQAKAHDAVDKLEQRSDDGPAAPTDPGN